MSKLYANAAMMGCTGIQSITTEASYSNISANAVVECTGTTLSLGDFTYLDFGTDDSHAYVLQGYVKKIERIIPERTYRVTVYDPLIRAVDYFLAADNPDDPLTYHSISDRDLVNDLLTKCGLSLDSSATLPSFSFGTNADGAKFNLQSVAEVIQWVCSITGKACWYDFGVLYENRRPYVVDGDSPDNNWVSGNGGQILSCKKELDSSRIRNKVTVYGLGNLHSTASASSPYVVVDQTSVIAHPLLDTQAICDATASVNLEILNRLSQTLYIDLVGDVLVKPRVVYHVTDGFTDTDDDVFAYSVRHNFSADGFTTSVTAVI